MAEISAKDVMALREQTGAGMMDCKKALAEAGGDTEKAIDILRQKGLKKSAEKASRVANEGIILTHLNETKTSGTLLEINCETDFVARNEDFVAFSKNVLNQIATTRPTGLDELLSSPASFNGSKTIKDSLSELTGKIGEKLEIKRFVTIDVKNGVLAGYVHPGNKLGVIVQLTADGLDDAARSEAHALAYDMAMQTAAMNPGYVRKEDVPQDVIQKESAILREQTLAEGKPEKIVDNIVKGRLEKFYQEVCLLEQTFVKDNAKTVKDLINAFGKKVGKPVTVERFERYRLGE
jgi:elongation factor Ts